MVYCSLIAVVYSGVQKHIQIKIEILLLNGSKRYIAQTNASYLENLNKLLRVGSTKNDAFT